MKYKKEFREDKVNGFLTNMDKKDDRKLILIDVDGVLYDLTKALNKANTLLGMIPLCDEEIIDYSYKGYPEWVREEIFKEFQGTAIWSRSNCYYRGAIEFIKSIVAMVDSNKYSVVLHTLVATEEGGGYRYRGLHEWLVQNELFKDVSIWVDVAKKRVMPNSLVLIEDYLNNLRDSVAPIKLVAAHPYNSLHKVDCVGAIDTMQYWVGSSYYSLFNAFITLLKQYENNETVDYASIEYVPVSEEKCFYKGRLES